MSDKVAAVPESFAIRACRAFAQLGDPLFHTVYWLFWKDSCASSQGVRGVSLIFSSGDDGVGDGDPNPATQRCFTNDGRNATRFMPNFPPFVSTLYEL